MLPRRGDRFLPALTGVLLVVSFPPLELLVAPFVALVPFLVFLAGLPPGREARMRALRAGYFLGMIYFGLLLYWQAVALVYYSILAVPAYMLSVLVLSAFTAGFAAALHYALERTRAPLALAAAIFWTACEWLQANLHDLAFPWLGLGTALAAAPTIAGAADLVGARGLTFWLALANGILARLVIRARAGQPVVRAAAVFALVAAAPAAYGVWRAQTLELRPAARVAVVQPNIPEELKLDATRALDSSMVALTNLTSGIPARTVDLVVWPEMAIPYAVELASGRTLAERVRALSGQVDAPILVGAYGIESDDDGETTYFNSAFLVGADGIVGEPYHKQRLVPFVERVPFVDPARLRRLVGDLRHFGGLGRGAGPIVFGGEDRSAHRGPQRSPNERHADLPLAPSADGSDSPARTAYGVLICYESIFSRLSRRYRLQNANFLVNITNDAWFGRESAYTRTSALWQHPSHLPLRAIETRTGIARAANTGISMFVDPLGRRYEETELFVADVRTATVFTTDGLTLYARWGDWLATSATLAAVLLLLWARLSTRGPSLFDRRRREPQTGLPGPRVGRNRAVPDRAVPRGLIPAKLPAIFKGYRRLFLGRVERQ